MEQQEAVKALQFLKRVVNQAQDDTAVQNWGAIWMLHAFTNGGGFIATNLMLARNVDTTFPYQLLWFFILTFNISMIFLLKTRRTGVKSFVETQIWSIWMTFVGGVLLVAAINQLMGLKLFYLGPIIGVLSANAMASMAAIAGRRHWFAAALFSAASLLMCVFPRWQFLILGLSWTCVQFPLGLFLHLERKRSGQVRIV